MSAEIPGWFDFAATYDAAIARAADGAHFVETGTFFGKSAHYMATAIARSGKAIRFDTWDNWQGVPPESTDPVQYPGWIGPPLQETETRARLAGLPVQVETGDALAAAFVYDRDTLDFVFLDDTHTTDHVFAECIVWWSRVKPGGVLAGHDWHWPSVRDAVERFAALYRVTVLVPRETTWWIEKPWGGHVA